MITGKRTKLIFSMICLVVLCLLPFFVSGYFQYLLILTCLYAYLACSWNIIGGMGGQLSVGHAVFFGVGGYTSTILFQKYAISPWIGMWIGALLASFTGAFIGLLCFRYKVRGVFFALVTLAFGEIARIIALNTKILGRSEGLLVPPPSGGNSWSIFQFETKVPYFFIILAMTMALFFLIRLIQSSRFISYLRAIREDEDAARALGIDTFKRKFWGLVISAFLTALGGTFYAQYTLYLDPPSMFGMMRSIDSVVISIIGGIGTIWGPLIGAVVYTAFLEITTFIFKGGYGSSHLILYGILMMIIIIVFPQGIVSLFEKQNSESQHVARNR